VPSAGFKTDPSPRDTHLLTIASLGRLGWQTPTGYGKRASDETAMGRYKSLIGERLRSGCDAARHTEAVVGAAVFNRMLDAARPNSVRLASVHQGRSDARIQHRRSLQPGSAGDETRNGSQALLASGATSGSLVD
jgi:hypothetical protein